MNVTSTPRQPVLVLQHQSSDGPAYLAQWLHQHGVAMDLRNAEAGDSRPRDMQGFSALAILGGEMGANDDLPALRRDEALFLDALERGIPSLGHCLGGQLMARALGARVSASPQPEVGWHEIEVDGSEAARAWFGDQRQARVFHWHYDAFELPRGAERLATSAACPNQAFAYGPHLAMQFHVELDAAKLERWLLEADDRYHGAMGRHATVQDAPTMRRDAARQLAQQQAIADRIYRRWLVAATAYERAVGSVSA